MKKKSLWLFSFSEAWKCWKTMQFTCKEKFASTMASPSFQEVSQLFYLYMYHLQQSNGKLSKFWMSYVDMMQVLLGLIRGLREGDWELHLSSFRDILPWCLAYDNLNYARHLSEYLSKWRSITSDLEDFPFRLVEAILPGRYLLISRAKILSTKILKCQKKPKVWA